MYRRRACGTGRGLKIRTAPQITICGVHAQEHVRYWFLSLWGYDAAFGVSVPEVSIEMYLSLRSDSAPSLVPSPLLSRSSLARLPVLSLISHITHPDTPRFR